jgi:hypothetical protein
MGANLDRAGKFGVVIEKSPPEPDFVNWAVCKHLKNFSDAMKYYKKGGIWMVFAGMITCSECFHKVSSGKNMAELNSFAPKSIKEISSLFSLCLPEVNTEFYDESVDQD